MKFLANENFTLDRVIYLREQGFDFKNNIHSTPLIKNTRVGKFTALKSMHSPF